MSIVALSIATPLTLAFLSSVFLCVYLTAHFQWAWYCFLSFSVATVWAAAHYGRKFRDRLDKIISLLTKPDSGATEWGDRITRTDRLDYLEQLVRRRLDADNLSYSQMRLQKEELEALVETMAEGIVVIDSNGIIGRYNPAAVNLFGQDTQQDWTGRPFREFSRHPLLGQLISANSPRSHNSQEIEIEGTAPRQLGVTVVPFPSNTEQGTREEASGARKAYMLSCHDLTAIKNLESERADFVANVSHELRTPLTAIKGYAETLLNGAVKDPENATRFLTIIDRHSERLSRLIDDLLTLSDLELGKTALAKDNFLVGDLVQEAFDVIQDKARRGGVTLAQDIPSSLPAILVDRDRLHQVLINLVDNAVKHTKEDGLVRVSAHLRRSDTDDIPLPDGSSSSNKNLYTGPQTEIGLQNTTSILHWLEIRVTDNGCGILEEDLPRLTQRFYRVDKARSRKLGGTGLGLAIVKHIVHAHGGELEIESQIDHGTTVHVVLPLTTIFQNE